jgi:hypothetical protein
MELQPCGNCGARLSGEFCQRCGQRRANQIGISRILQDGFAHVFDLESGFLCTLRGLSMRPGAFIRDYLAGKRQSCTNPLKYCFVVITIYALAINLLDINLTWVMR